MLRISLSPCFRYQSRRLFSTEPKGSAGKDRFYLQVGVERYTPDLDSISSPISAGVDDTDSASGVSRETDNNSDWRLLSRPPSTLEGEPSRKLHNSNWFTVTLDGRSLKTPLGKPLVVPTEDLAYLIAAEWNTKSIQPAQMPLMKLACTALDQAGPAFAAQSLRFLQTDTICYWADPTEDRILYSRQQRAWKDFHKWIRNDFCQSQFAPSQAFGNSEGMLFLKTKTGIGLDHPDGLVEACTKWISKLDSWHLTALHSVCSDAKSFWVGVGVLTGQLNAKQAVEAARVEEEVQIEQWGLVEGQHDYDRLNSSIQITAASVLVQSLDISCFDDN